MNILHIKSWKVCIVQRLTRRRATERRSHVESARKRDMLPQANQHLLRDVGLDNLAEERSENGHR